jgi:hypothetical protein
MKGTLSVEFLGVFGAIFFNERLRWNKVAKYQ